MNVESFESLNKNDLIKLLLQWGRSNDLLTARLKQLEIENIYQREEIRTLKGQPGGYGNRRPVYEKNCAAPIKPYQKVSGDLDCSV